MAQYKHLPIYKTTYELLEKVTRKTKDFPRDFKYSLGDKIRNECIELVVFIYKANSIKHERENNLKQILERVQVKKGYWFNGALTKMIKQGVKQCIYA